MGAVTLELNRCADALEILARLAVLVAKEEFDQDILTPAGRTPPVEPDISYVSQPEMAMRRIDAALAGIPERQDGDVVTYEEVPVHGDTLSEEEREFLRMWG